MTASGQMTIWMRLRNAREVVAGLRQTAAATGVLGGSVDRLARHMERAGRRTFILNQAIFTLRRYSYMATLALTASAAAALKWGFDYNSQVQQATLAFGKFGLTGRQVKQEIKELYRIAAISPFLFTDITAAARRFMAFGIDVKTTNALIHNLTDSLTAMGFTTGASLNRATLAIAHMSSIGRVTGQIVYQLARDNVPIIQALEQELGLTGDQLRNVAQLGIPASVAIQALNKYISSTPRFHGAALLFATRTWRGIVTTTRDYIAQFLGTVERPLFNRLQQRARTFLFWLTGAAQRGFNRGGVAGMFATFSPAAARAWRMFAETLSSVWRILVNGVIPGFTAAARVIGPLIYLALWPTIKLFDILSRHTLLAKIFFAILAFEVGILALKFAVLLPLQTAVIVKDILWNAVQRVGIALGLIRIVTIDTETGAIIANTAATRKNIIQLTLLGRLITAVMLRSFIEMITAIRRMTGAWSLLTKGYIVGSTRMSYATKSLEGRVLRLRIAFLALRRAVWAYIKALYEATAAQLRLIFTNPLTYVVLAIAALGILYWKWKAFRDAVNEVVTYLWNHPLIALITPVIGPLIFMSRLLTEIYRHWRQIYNLAKHPLGGGFFSDIIRSGLSGGIAPVGLLRGVVPGLAGGGYVSQGGIFQVGEHGRELAYLPTGSAVRPVNGGAGATPLDMSRIIFEIHNRTTVDLDGQKLAESMSKHRLDAQARR